MFLFVGMIYFNFKYQIDVSEKVMELKLGVTLTSGLL